MAVHGELGYADRLAGTSSRHARSTGHPLDRLTKSKQSSTSPTFGMTKAILTVIPASFRLSISPGADAYRCPTLKEDELIGAIVIYRQEVRPFSDKQIELLTAFAARPLSPSRNTRLLNELRQRTDDLTDLLDQQTATSEILRVISASPTDLQPIFDAIVRSASRLCGGEAP